jgi:thiol-disulfide isomerase/thioredoxin
MPDERPPAGGLEAEVETYFDPDEPQAEGDPAEGDPAVDLAPEPARRVRRRGVGPFSLRQVTIAIALVMGVAIILTLATVPLGTTEPGLPVPDPSAFLIGSPEPGLNIGNLAPELTGNGPDGTVQLSDLNGAPIRLADLRGKAVWVNFWASWCPPCQFETPVVRAIDAKYRDRGLVVVAIQVQQTVDDGRSYAQRYGLRYTIGADVTGAIFHTYRVFALPTQFFIDPNGVLRQIVNGPLSETRASQLIESILPPSPSGLPTLGGSAPG